MGQNHTSAFASAVEWVKDVLVGKKNFCFFATTDKSL